MEIECEHIWRNDDYDVQFDELKERYESLGMPIPKKDLKKLPEQWIANKITFDPVQVLPFYVFTENISWTAICIEGEWFTIKMDYEKFKELRNQSLRELEEQEDISEIVSNLEIDNEQKRQNEETSDEPQTNRIQ